MPPCRIGNARLVSAREFHFKLIARIEPDRLTVLCFIGENAPDTLGFVIEDYILHMQHHIDQLLRRDVVRQYPGASFS
jgi:hypothetical protein